jgi:mono/diheme cytochrome c family protein
MKILFAVLAALAVCSPAFAKTAAELEKEKALQNPYPNDFGPDKIDEAVIKTYPADKQEGYKLMLQRCSQCHSPARPINSRFVEPDAGDPKPADRPSKENAALSKMKAEHADWFKDPTVWQVETEVWNRYVKRMLSKPGCGVDVGGHMTTAEAGKIYKFLVYDGQRRKLGANAEKWKAHRMKLVEELKTKNPKRYEELKGQNDL